MMAEGTAGHPVGTLTPEEIAKRAETRAKNADAVATIATYLSEHKELPKKFVAAINHMVKLDSRRSANSLYERIINFIRGEKVPGVDTEPPGEGQPVDDMTLFMAFRVADTDMRKVLYQGQDNGVWISAVKNGRDTIYTFVAESEDMPEGYPADNLRKPRKKGEDS